MESLNLLLIVALSTKIATPFEHNNARSIDIDLGSVYISNMSLSVLNEDARLTVPQIIAKYGYPVETHSYVTADGYVLTAHRIPFGKKCGPEKRKRVVFLQHGLLCDSSIWIIAGPEKGLAYNLANECYDVWLGNFRGNTYSRRHMTLDPVKSKKEFWTFSWHEHGLYDLPAGIDYVLKATGADGIYYIGHSMGSTAFWVCMSERPEYNSKIKLMSAFAPVAYMEHMKSPVRIFAPYERLIVFSAKVYGIYELMPSYTKTLRERVGRAVCHQVSMIKEVCSNILFLLGGYDSDQLDRDILPNVFGHVPTSTSVQTVAHYGQNVKSGMFRKFDYGQVKNYMLYGSPVPPEYTLEKITAPVALYWSENDWLAAEIDVYRLARRLPNLLRMYHFTHRSFNHCDFMLAKDVVSLVNQPVIEFMKNY